MYIIKIEQLESGCHDNQQINGAVVPPEGWAIIPDNINIPDTYPFVDFTVELNDEDGYFYVTSMTANQEAYDEYMKEIPEPVGPEEDDTWDSMAAAIMEGVNEV